jgi:hypothetical protein
MNPPKCNEYDYINFLMASPRIFSCTEAGRVQPEQKNAPAHDSINRLLYRLPTDTEALRNEAVRFADVSGGIMVLDDSTLDKPYGHKIQMVNHHWSGKHHGVVRGINVVTLLWTDGDTHIPCDYRIYHKEADNKTENEHFADMLHKAGERGARPEYVLFDSWYSGIENLRRIRNLGWHWLTRLKANRSVNPDGIGNIALSAADISESGTTVHLKKYGFIKVFRIAAKDGSTEYRATSDTDTDELSRLQLSDFSWRIEEYHRGLKQFCGAERSFVRLAGAQRNHIGLAIRAFLRFEIVSLRTGLSWFEAKIRIIRDAIKAYLANPIYALQATA